MGGGGAREKSEILPNINQEKCKLILESDSECKGSSATAGIK